MSERIDWLWRQMRPPEPDPKEWFMPNLKAPHPAARYATAALIAAATFIVAVVLIRAIG